ncbi:MAG TPA: histidine kinase [Burkholderiaceae bacterium]|nr:histidine kinase [Burkholderiaceae bacterium]
MGLMASLDPRRHLSAAIGWSLLAVVALASLVAGNRAAAEAERAARASTERLLAQFATQVDHGLRMNLRNRLAIVQATAAQIAASGDKGSDALRRHLDAVQLQFPEFAWLGVADVHGRVMTATGGLLGGESVAQRPWFSAAQAGPHLGDVHKAVLLEKHLPRSPDGQPLRFVDAAAPIRLDDGRLAGVVGAHLAWGWVDRLQAELLGSLDSRRQLELVLADGEGIVMVGPQDWIGRRLQELGDLGEGGTYIVGRHVAKDVDDAGLGWKVAVRQPAEPALAPVRSLHRTVFATVLLGGLVAALLAQVVTHWLTRRLAGLAAEATAVRQGRQISISVPAGQDEVSRIGATMAELVEHLQREKAALKSLNAELDARVVERTARIERLADESRHAAVTRERLRLARDLHDTLGHSLMALLTQLRLLRKLKDRMSEDEFGAELGRAEDVAASGLAEARAAITQIRHGTVRENGLAAALRDLLGRFGERTGVQATLQARGWAADLADERAETLYRIVEEALRNVERHAQARSVVVEIDGDPACAEAAGQPTAPRATLSVRDDGVGFDTAVPCPGHYGMLGMREQADLIGADLQVCSQPGQGTSVRLGFAA